jgi:hypothetical protein
VERFDLLPAGELSQIQLDTPEPLAEEPQGWRQQARGRRGHESDPQFLPLSMPP